MRCFTASAIPLLFSTAVALGSCGGGGGGGGHSDPRVFVQTATVANIVGNGSVIDNSRINGDPGAVFLVTPNWNPGGTAGVYDDHEIGVWYDGTNWNVFNQDGAAMPVGAAFNVYVPPEGDSLFTWTAKPANIGANWTRISSPALDANPGAIPLITSNWNPSGSVGVNHDHSIGVFYNGGPLRWEIFNEDTVPMVSGPYFNVYVPPAGPSLFVHTATLASIVSNSTYISHPRLDGDPNAIALVTQSLGVYNDAAVGLWYDTTAGQWAIFNQSGNPMPLNAAFDVFIP